MRVGTLGATTLRRIVGAAIVGMVAAMAMAGGATAAPGQCLVTGYETFPCDVALDGGGLAFDLPDGQTFAFALIEPELGVAYIDRNTEGYDDDTGENYQYVRPKELGEFRPVAGEAGCWASTGDDFRFCVLVEK